MSSESKYFNLLIELYRLIQFLDSKVAICNSSPLVPLQSSTHEPQNLTKQLGGSIGTSLFLGIGSSLAQAGPLSLVLGFSISGLAVYGMMLSLGEMATWLPIPGAIPQFCSRFVDGALGFAVGWNARISDLLLYSDFLTPRRIGISVPL